MSYVPSPDHQVQYPSIFLSQGILVATNGSTHLRGPGELLGMLPTKAALGRKCVLLGALIKGMLSTEMLLNPTQWQTEKDLLDCQWARVYYSHRGNKQWPVSANFYGNNVF